MDIASIVGFLIALAMILLSAMMGTTGLGVFIDIPSIAVVCGGTFGVVLLCFPLRTFLTTPMVLKVVFLNTTPNVSKLIEQLVSLAETARRDGLLALEGKIKDINDPFIRVGVQMAVDGARPEVLEDVLKTDMGALAGRHRDGKNLMDQIGKYAPAFGMIGTLIGLIMMLADMSDPSGIGKGMAVALITTLYGAVISNAMFLPFAEKLAAANKAELQGKEIILRGILAIQSGENPRVVRQKLLMYLPPKQRPKDEGR